MLHCTRLFRSVNLRPLQMTTRFAHSGPRVPYERNTFAWWKEYAIIMMVFAVTGSSSLYIVRPTLKHVFGLEGTLRDGPNSFRAAYLCTTIPTYSLLLVTIGTLAGRGPYFRAVASRMWGRFIPWLREKPSSNS